MVLWSTAHQLAWPVLRPLVWLYRRSVLRALRVVAVTGSFGKTTTTRAIAAALDCPIPKGANHNTGFALRILRTKPGTRFGSFEIGISGPGQMRPLARMVRPNCTVLTGIGSEHARSLGSLENTLDEKAELIRALPPAGTTLLNADDPLALSAAASAPGPVLTFGFSPEADVRAVDCRVRWPHGNNVRASVEGREIEVQTQLVGRHMVYPVLAALSAAHVEGVDLQLAAERLTRFRPAHGRMATRALPNGAMLIDDSYKGSFESYIAAIDTLADLPADRRVLILGDITEPPGSQTEAYRALGKRTALVENSLLLHVGRESQRIRAGAKRAGFPAENIHCLGEEVMPALETIRGVIKPSDVVLLKGRDTQKFERILLSLEGKPVRCALKYCDKRGQGCHDCPMLERGWEGLTDFMDTRKLGTKQ